MTTIISVGKKHEYDNAIKDYQKRLSGRFVVKWVLIPNSTKNGKEAQNIESEGILKAINQSDHVILLDENGKNLSSPAFSKYLCNRIYDSKQIVFVIGGAYGVSDKLKNRADFIWSLSNLVFPHQLVRLILIEQIYRAQSIANNHPYHHQ